MEKWLIPAPVVVYVIILLFVEVRDRIRDAKRDKKEKDGKLYEAIRNRISTDDELLEMTLNNGRTVKEALQDHSSEDQEPPSPASSSSGRTDYDTLIANAARQPIVEDHFAASRGEADVMPEGLEFYNLYPDASEPPKATVINRREGFRRSILAIEWIWVGAWTLIGITVSRSIMSEDFVLVSAIGWTPFLLHRLGAWVMAGFRPPPDKTLGPGASGQLR